ncbi:hypothetical protein CC2G_012338 [Coprinopsis cinerea AmutBmut pab1-1]|nr:hypothetical protein CC2G_012338 [Coprinopsis cinerea AmutBmut pab1-1]
MRLGYMIVSGVLAILQVALAIPGTTASSRLLARQIPGELLSTVPSRCQDNCRAAVGALDRCGNLAGDEALDCTCQTSTLDAMQECFPCIFTSVGQLSNAEIAEQVEQLITVMVGSCRTAGRPVPGYDGVLPDSDGDDGDDGDSPVSNDDDDADDDDDATATVPAPSGGSSGSGSGSGTGTGASGAKPTTTAPSEGSDDADSEEDGGSAVLRKVNLGGLVFVALGAVLLA